MKVRSIVALCIVHPAVHCIYTSDASYTRQMTLYQSVSVLSCNVMSIKKVRGWLIANVVFVLLENLPLIGGGIKNVFNVIMIWQFGWLEGDGLSWMYEYNDLPTIPYEICTGEWPDESCHTETTRTCHIAYRLTSEKGTTTGLIVNDALLLFFDIAIVLMESDRC
eukprot:20463_1